MVILALNPEPDSLQVVDEIEFLPSPVRQGTLNYSLVRPDVNGPGYKHDLSADLILSAEAAGKIGLV
jgi:hypothetical protein